MSYTTTSNSIPSFFLLPSAALIDCRSLLSFLCKKHSFFVYFMLRVSYDLYTSSHLSFFACLTRHKKVFFRLSLCVSSLSAKEIKDNKLYRIGIKMKILYNKFCSACKCVYVSVFGDVFQGTSEKTDGTKLKKWNTLGKFSLLSKKHERKLEKWASEMKAAEERKERRRKRLGDLWSN